MLYASLFWQTVPPACMFVLRVSAGFRALDRVVVACRSYSLMLVHEGFALVPCPTGVSVVSRRWPCPLSPVVPLNPCSRVPCPTPTPKPKSVALCKRCLVFSSRQVHLETDDCRRVLRAFLLFYCHWLACIWSMALHLVDPKFPQWIDEIEASDALFGINTRASEKRRP